MAMFQYEAVTMKGKKVKGVQRSVSKFAAITDLQAKGFTIRSIQEKKVGILDKEITFGRPVKLEHFVIFCRQFATLIRSGIQIDTAVRILEEQNLSKKLSEALMDIGDKIRNGSQLSKAMQDHPRIFPEMFINMVGSAEFSGTLDSVLDRMATHYEKELKTFQKVKSAMTYPIVVMSISILVVIFLMIKIIPTFTGMFQEQGAELPMITKLVMSVSGSMQHFWWLYLFIVIAAILVVRVLQANKQAKIFMDKYKFYFPIFGPLMKQATISRLIRTLAELMTSAVPLLQALQITEKVVGNSMFEAVLADARRQLEQGQTLSRAISDSGLFPPLVIHMLKVGEETGQVDGMLIKVADFIDNEVEQTVDRLKTTLEPLLMLFVSVIVGAIIAAIMAPMFKLYETYI